MSSQDVPGDVECPPVIQRYQAAHDAHDTELALSTFRPDASVTDEDRDYEGLDEIRTWLETAGRQFTYTRTLVSARAVAVDDWLIHNRLEGDFPGGVADLRYQFTLVDDHIARLVIAP